MAREETIIGLHAKTDKYTDKIETLGKKITSVQYLDGTIEILKLEPYQVNRVVINYDSPYTHFDWLGNKVGYRTFIHPNGSKYIECVQVLVWDGGPYTFTALVDEYDNWIVDSLWSIADINSFMGRDLFNNDSPEKFAPVNNKEVCIQID